MLVEHMIHNNTEKEKERATLVSLQPCEMNEISSYQLTITPKSL